MADGTNNGMDIIPAERITDVVRVSADLEIAAHFPWVALGQAPSPGTPGEGGRAATNDGTGAEIAARAAESGGAGSRPA